MIDDPYERGRLDGEIQERLASHDRHFALINGQLERVAASLAQMTVAVSQLGDRQQSIVTTTQATHAALQAAADQRWSRWQKLFAVVGALAAFVGVYLAWRTGMK